MMHIEYLFNSINIYPSETRKSDDCQDAADEDMGVSAAAEDAESEYLQQMCERELVQVLHHSFLFLRTVLTICSQYE